MKKSKSAGDLFLKSGSEDEINCGSRCSTPGSLVQSSNLNTAVLVTGQPGLAAVNLNTSTPSLLAAAKASYAMTAFNDYIKKVKYPFAQPAPDQYHNTQISVADMMRECRTGDMIMQGTNNKHDELGKALVGVTQSRMAVSHVLLVWRDPETDIPYGLTSQRWAFFPETLPAYLMYDYMAGVPIDGVQMHPLLEFMSAMAPHDYYFYWRPLFRNVQSSAVSTITGRASARARQAEVRVQDESEEREMSEKIYRFYESVIGAAYPSDFDMFRRFQKMKSRSKNLAKPGDPSTFHCAEIASLALQDCGVLRPGVYPWWNASASDYEAMGNVERQLLCTEQYSFGASVLVQMRPREDTIFGDFDAFDRLCRARLQRLAAAPSKVKKSKSSEQLGAEKPDVANGFIARLPQARRLKSMNNLAQSSLSEATSAASLSSVASSAKREGTGSSSAIGAEQSKEGSAADSLAASSGKHIADSTERGNAEGSDRQLPVSPTNAAADNRKATSSWSCAGSGTIKEADMAPTLGSPDSGDKHVVRAFLRTVARKLAK